VSSPEAGCSFRMCLQCCGNTPNDPASVKCDLIYHRLMYDKCRETDKLRGDMTELQKKLDEIQKQMGENSASSSSSGPQQQVTAAAPSDQQVPVPTTERPRNADSAAEVTSVEAEAARRDAEARKAKAKDAAWATVSVQLDHLSQEVADLRGKAAAGKVQQEDLEVCPSVSDVVFRPSQWIKVVVEACETQSDALARVDQLVMAIDRYYRICELKVGGPAALASARALESVRSTLSAIARSPGEAEHMRPILQPVAKILYANYLLITHGPESAGRWSAAVSAKTDVEESYVEAFQSLPPALRRPREERREDRGGRQSWGGGRGFGRGGRNFARGRGWGRGHGSWGDRKVENTGGSAWDGSQGRSGTADRGRRGYGSAAGTDEQSGKDLPRRG